MIVDINKQYQTQSGKMVRIYSTDAGGSYPVHGAIFENETKGWIVVSWTKEGKHIASENSPSDIVEAKPRIQRELWLNLYRDKTVGYYYAKEYAHKGARPDRIACVKVVIDCEEGEGL